MICVALFSELKRTFSSLPCLPGTVEHFSTSHQKGHRVQISPKASGEVKPLEMMQSVRRFF